MSNGECIACGGSGMKSKPGPGADPECEACGGSGAGFRPIVQHSSKSVEHYTPQHIVEAARTVLGAIDLDPASCPLAQEIVSAEAWYGPESPFGVDGLAEPWLGRVFLNPPGGRVPEQYSGLGTKSNAALWWARLSTAWESGEVESAIFIGFSLEILRSAQTMEGPQPLDFPLCVPWQRIAFDTEDDGERIETTQPTNANVIIYLPARQGSPPLDCVYPQAVEKFQATFAPIGRVRT